jgi:hypothetical protein
LDSETKTSVLLKTKSMKLLNTKKLKFAFLFVGISSIANLSQAQTPSMVIGGIEANGMRTTEEGVLRTIIYKSLVASKKYTVNDRYDISEKVGYEVLKKCMGKECLVSIGKQLNSDYAMSASYDALGDRILISMKIVDVKTGSIYKNEIGQFENQFTELNRMTDIMIYRLLDIPINENVEKMLSFKDNPAASYGPGKMNNSGPRIGLGYAFGANGDYFTRSENEGGRGVPTAMVFNLGYQLEAQYVGNENFSGLFEFIFNVGGLEQGIAIPSLAILHGARFGKNSWEIAVGPSLSVKQLVRGSEDNGAGFQTESELNRLGIDISEFNFYQRPDTRGAHYFSTNFVVGIGRNFQSGAINIPVNAFASVNKYGTSFGISMGMNINKRKSSIQANKR